MDAKEVADILRVHPSTVYRLQQRGEFKLPMTEARLEAWLETKRVGVRPEWPLGAEAPTHGRAELPGRGRESSGD